MGNFGLDQGDPLAQILISASSRALPPCEISFETHSTREDQTLQEKTASHVGRSMRNLHAKRILSLFLSAGLKRIVRRRPGRLVRRTVTCPTPASHSLLAFAFHVTCVVRLALTAHARANGLHTSILTAKYMLPPDGYTNVLLSQVSQMDVHIDSRPNTPPPSLLPPNLSPLHPSCSLPP